MYLRVHEDKFKLFSIKYLFPIDPLKSINGCNPSGEQSFPIEYKLAIFDLSSKSQAPGFVEDIWILR